MPITASPGTSGRYSRYIGSWRVTGSGCCAAAVGPQVVSAGTSSTKSNNGHRCCDPNCVSPTGSCRHSRCCESIAEERGAGNPHATFCGNRGRVTASGDPVGWETGRWPSAPSYRAHPRLYLYVPDQTFFIVAVCWGMTDTLQVITPRISDCTAHLAPPQLRSHGIERSRSLQILVRSYFATARETDCGLLTVLSTVKANATIASRKRTLSAKPSNAR